MLRISLAVLHLVALGIGLGAVFARARAMNDLAVPGALKRAFVADTWWGLAALLWISTGLWRLFASMEKSAGYYWDNHVFYAKMGLFALVFLLELWPMITLIRWRMADAKGSLPPLGELAPTGKRIARISDIETLAIVCIVIAAVMVARGYGV